jgi:hypothetical protein
MAWKKCKEAPGVSQSYLITLLSLDELCRQEAADGLLHELIHALK